MMLSLNFLLLQFFMDKKQEAYYTPLFYRNICVKMLEENVSYCKLVKVIFTSSWHSFKIGGHVKNGVIQRKLHMYTLRKVQKILPYALKSENTYLLIVYGRCFHSLILRWVPLKSMLYP